MTFITSTKWIVLCSQTWGLEFWELDFWLEDEISKPIVHLLVEQYVFFLHKIQKERPFTNLNPSLGHLYWLGVMLKNLFTKYISRNRINVPHVNERKKKWMGLRMNEWLMKNWPLGNWCINQYQLNQYRKWVLLDSIYSKQ